MARRSTYVTLTVDTSRYVAALARAAESLDRLAPRLRVIRSELPHLQGIRAAAMHRDYDRRRRARRRRHR